MLVKTIMSSPVISVQPDSQVGHALELMKSNHIRHLPVVGKDGSLVGLVSESDLIKVYPKGHITSYQLNLISRTPVKTVMNTNPKTIHPDDAIEQAVEMMRQFKLVCLPVIENDLVTGLICEDDILRSFISILGLGQPGLRITLRHRQQKGFLSKLVALLDASDIIIDKMATFQQEIVLKVQSRDPEQLLTALKDNGFEILHYSNVPSLLTHCNS
ncbi:MAG TPA: CBS domain-containing protein [Bacillota bacterium]|nr:CBS domain-containing protein [Bacillota bacterium]